ncbi:hypothetical protein V8B97DRAFT_1012646 [Scleroderma yunnanense]
MNYPDDGVAVKLFVMIIWILDTVHVSLMCHALYYYLVSSYGVVSAWADNVLIRLNYSECTSMHLIWWLQSAVCTCVSHAWFRHSSQSIFYLCRRRLRWLVTIPIIVTILAHFGFGIDFPRRHSAPLPNLRAKRLIDTLVIYVIDRCLLTSLVTIAEVIVSLIDSNTSWYMAIDFILGEPENQPDKLWSTSTLSSLPVHQIHSHLVEML